VTNDDAPSAASHSVVFLPFLRLEKGYTVAGVEFLPLRDPVGGVPAVLQDALEPLDRILSGYVDRHNEPFTNCVVATIPGKGWNLADRDFTKVEWAASLLFLASWARNEYFPRFGGSYVNSTNFRVVGQRFSGDVPTYIAISARRRDGHSMDGGYEHGEFRFNLPVQCSIRDDADIDQGFLTALDTASTNGAATVNRLRTALPFVQLANTDDEFMIGPAEAILMGSAFEQLLRADASAYRLSKKLGNVFDQFGSVRVVDAKTARPNLTIDASPGDSRAWRVWKKVHRFIPWNTVKDPVDQWLSRRLHAAHSSWWAHRKWIEELYDLRSKVVHRGHHAGRNWGWNIFEHLVMSAYVFPLAVKLLLAENGHYQLSDDDRVRCLAVDKLLASVRWVEDRNAEDDESEESWTAVTARVRRDLDWERAWEAVRQQYPDMFQED